MEQLGVGTMIQMLGGNEATVNVIREAIGKRIKEMRIDDEANGGDGMLRISFDDGSALNMYDSARLCCESRYMHTDETLSDFTGAELKSVEVRAAPDAPSEYGDCHEVQFLVLVTDKGNCSLSTHNEHNGYYGGFSIAANADAA